MKFDAGFGRAAGRFLLLGTALLVMANTSCTRNAPTPQPDEVLDEIRGHMHAEHLPPLHEPVIRSLDDADHMRDDDYILGVVVDGQARAYPWWVMKNYHMANDWIGDTPVLVTVCEQCSAIAGFRRAAQDQVLTMKLLGLYRGTIILEDQETKSVWAPFDGEAMSGTLKGERLERIPVRLVRWDKWKEHHPATTVVWDSEQHRKGHGAWYSPGKWGIIQVMGDTIQEWDTRLPENDLVFGVQSGQRDMAYPLAVVKGSGGVVNDNLDDVPIVLFARGDYEIIGYQRQVDGQTLTFEPAGDAADLFVDRETGTRWSMEGECVEGPLKGKSLANVEGHLSEWHVWSGYHPETGVFEGPATSIEGFSLPPLKLIRYLGDREPAPVPLAGKVNLVVLWSAWCPPCREEMPKLQKLLAKHGSQGLAIQAIAIHVPGRMERNAVDSFMKKEELSLPVHFIDESSYTELDSRLRAAGGKGIIVPMVLVTDSQGNVHEVMTGKNELASLSERVDRLLAESQ